MNSTQLVKKPINYLLRSLINKTGELGKYHYYYRSDKGHFNAVKYEDLPAPYNQLALIRQSAFYQLNTNRSNMVFRNGTDGVPDIFDCSIQALYKPANRVEVSDPWEWVNNGGNYPHHCKNVHHNYVEWR